MPKGAELATFVLAAIAGACAVIALMQKEQPLTAIGVLLVAVAAVVHALATHTP